MSRSLAWSLARLQPRSEAYHRHLAYERWRQSLDCRGQWVVYQGRRPDVAWRNRERARQRWIERDLHDPWLAFKARSDARAKAWQEKRQRRTCRRQ